MLSLVLLLTAAAAPAQPQVRYVTATVARLRAGMDPSSAVRATLPIGAEVRVLRQGGRSSEVETLDGRRGFVSQAALGSQPPTVEGLRQRYEAGGGRQDLERATALAPGDLALIERLASLEKNPQRLYQLRKGWVAAKRRSLSWDGPLYPIDGGRARLPARCDAHQAKPEGPDGMERGRASPLLRAERRRAFRWVSSGKVVSLSERGYTTEHLRAPRCDGERLAYPMKAHRGALVPSWMVAGYTVTPVRGGRAVSARRRVELSVEEAQLQVRATTFTTAAEASLKLSRPAQPVVEFSDGPDGFALLFQGPPCAPGESTVFLVRAQLESGTLRLTEGRPWGCAQSPLTPLEGEPRDVSREALLDPEWNFSSPPAR